MVFVFDYNFGFQLKFQIFKKYILGTWKKIWVFFGFSVFEYFDSFSVLNIQTNLDPPYSQKLQLFKLWTYSNFNLKKTNLKTNQKFSNTQLFNCLGPKEPKLKRNRSVLAWRPECPVSRFIACVHFIRTAFVAEMVRLKNYVAYFWLI